MSLFRSFKLTIDADTSSNLRSPAIGIYYDLIQPVMLPATARIGTLSETDATVMHTQLPTALLDKAIPCHGYNNKGKPTNPLSTSSSMRGQKLSSTRRV
jgi:hypothetical protein